MLHFGTEIQGRDILWVGIIEIVQHKAEAVQEQTAAALQELADMQEKKTELKGEIKSLSGTVAALKENNKS